MKKGFTITLIALVLLTLCACGSEPQPTYENEFMGFVRYMFDNFWRGLALFLMACMAISGPLMVMRYSFHAYDRFLRNRNIKRHGWPPPHIDADGDWKPEPKAEEEKK
jgi:hypothetical protein